MMKLNKNKKAQIGATLTWFVAFIVIFFAMILFIGVVSILSAGRTPSESQFSYGGKTISLSDTPGVPVGYDSGDLGLQGDLNSFLSAQTEDGNENYISIRDLISIFGDEVTKKSDMISY